MNSHASALNIDYKYLEGRDDSLERETYRSFLWGITEGHITKGVPEFASVAVAALEEYKPYRDRLEMGDTTFNASILRAHAREGLFSEGVELKIPSESTEIVLPDIPMRFGSYDLFMKLKNDCESPESKGTETGREAILLGILEGMSLGKIKTGQPRLMDFLRETQQEFRETRPAGYLDSSVSNAHFNMILHGLLSNNEISKIFEIEPDKEKKWVDRSESRSKGRVM